MPPLLLLKDRAVVAISCFLAMSSTHEHSLHVVLLVDSHLVAHTDVGNRGWVVCEDFDVCHVQ